MIFSDAGLPGVYLIELELKPDSRGFFARSFCKDEFSALGLMDRIRQANISFNTASGTLRGLHYQDHPHPESKIVRCTRGAAFDVVVDLRQDSPMYCQWRGWDLTAQNRRSVFIPPGCAHGFISLQQQTELSYLMSETYRPELARGVRWNDPAFSIRWPCQPSRISERDASYPDFQP